MPTNAIRLSLCNLWLGFSIRFSIRVTVRTVWADLVLVMEQKHKQKVLAAFPGEMKFKTLHVLDIPDDYRYMDPELIEEIKSAVDPLLSGAGG